MLDLFFFFCPHPVWTHFVNSALNAAFVAHVFWCVLKNAGSTPLQNVARPDQSSRYTSPESKRTDRSSATIVSLSDWFPGAALIMCFQCVTLRVTEVPFTNAITRRPTMYPRCNLRCTQKPTSTVGRKTRTAQYNIDETKCVLTIRFLNFLLLPPRLRRKKTASILQFRPSFQSVSEQY